MIADRAKRVAREVASVDENRSGSSAIGSQRSVTESQQIELEGTERRAKLFRLVDELADDQRRVVLMRFAEEKSIREIAESLGRSEGAVKQLQFRALENLRRRITTEAQRNTEVAQRHEL